MLTTNSGFFMRYVFCALALLFLCVSRVYCFSLPADDSSVQLRDSLYRRVLKEGVLTLSCHFSYVQGSFDIHPFVGDNSRELGHDGDNWWISMMGCPRAPIEHLPDGSLHVASKASGFTTETLILPVYKKQATFIIRVTGSDNTASIYYTTC
jgi:hypothetical protein